MQKSWIAKEEAIAVLESFGNYNNNKNLPKKQKYAELNPFDQQDEKNLLRELCPGVIRKNPLFNDKFGS